MNCRLKYRPGQSIPGGLFKPRRGGLFIVRAIPRSFFLFFGGAKPKRLQQLRQGQVDPCASKPISRRAAEKQKEGGGYWAGRTINRPPLRGFRTSALFIVLFSSLFQTHRSWADQLAIIPTNIVLSGPEARQRLLVEKIKDNAFVGQLTNQLEFPSSDASIFRMENDTAIPLTNGTATVQVKAGKQSATARVTVEKMEKPFDWSFRNHVQPVLAKNGCSAGACHGAAAGQNGFKLSLRGYDDEGDFLTLTRGAIGRRIVPSDPGRSLMLLKPTAAVPHKGGKRFEVGSLDYRVLSQWLAAGAPGPKADDPRIVKIEILPSHVILTPAATQQLSVRAWFSDGYSEDVTRWAKYTSANEMVSQVDEDGRTKVVGFGEGAITAWYLSRIDIATVTVPYTNKPSGKVFAQAKRRNFIDELVLEKLKSLNLPPSPRCNDSEFIRRAFIDTIGVLPTAQETRDFLSDTSRSGAGVSPATSKRDAGQSSSIIGPTNGLTCCWSAANSSKRLRCGPITTGYATMWRPIRPGMSSRARS